jgi:hypothetical protein
MPQIKEVHDYHRFKSTNPALDDWSDGKTGMTREENSLCGQEFRDGKITRPARAVVPAPENEISAISPADCFGIFVGPDRITKPSLTMVVSYFGRRLA